MFPRMILLVVSTVTVSLALVVGFPVLLPIVGRDPQILWGVAGTLWLVWLVSFMGKLLKSHVKKENVKHES